MAQGWEEYSENDDEGLGQDPEPSCSFEFDVHSDLLRDLLDCLVLAQ